ncbi:MAG: hypothetical protein KF784_11780 [Fimbriimonadaceae bacterium]|nr:hypothetical protein [Fimbriimonadaceae bacterium]
MSAPPVIPQQHSYSPPPPPPRNSSKAPLFVILGILFGGCLIVCGIGYWFVRAIGQDAVPAANLPPSIVAELANDWKQIKLDAIGLTMELPSLPERDDSLAMDDPDVSVYSRFAGYWAADDSTTVYIMALTSKFGALFELDDETTDFVDGYKADPGISGLTHIITTTTCAGKEARLVDMRFTEDGMPLHCKLIVFLDGRVTYYLQVYTDPDADLDAVANRVSASVTIHDSNSSMKEK